MGWYHLALVFHGPNPGEGMSVYHGWNRLTKDDGLTANEYPNPPDGTVVIGKYQTNGDTNYGSVMVDELTFWNRQLLPSEIQALATM